MREFAYDDRELVRCKDCKYWKSADAFHEIGKCNKNRYGDGFSPWDWYCADGEKSIFADLM